MSPDDCHDSARAADLDEQARDLEALLGQTAIDLQWAALLSALASRCVSQAGHRRLLELQPEDDLADARRRMKLCEQALAAMADGEPVVAYDVPNVAPMLERLDKGGVAAALELRDLGILLGAARQLRPYAQLHRERLPELATALWSEPDLDELERELGRCIDEDGNVRDHASRELAEARRHSRRLRRALLEEIERMTAKYADVLREGQHVERDGRYTLPVRSDAHRRVEGIVLGSSASGATLYVEPRQVTELGNRLAMAEGEVDRAVARVLAELSARAAEQAILIRTAYAACIEADVLATLSSFAEQSRGIAVMPANDGRVDLLAARHPLLALREGEVVPNDISVRAGSALVISGPNAGGKTVALKCLGLLCWMARAGLPLPVAAGSHVGGYGRVLTDFGDAQSIERSLSTFSAEVDNLRRIVGCANEETLVLLDEVAASTDPEEGSALAAAILEALTDRGAAVVVTTHYERLKELAAESDRFVNASVGFDFARMQPTFRLERGLPGASSALLVAARHGIPSPIIERARALLPTETVDRQRLLESLEQERSALAAAQAQAQAEAERLGALRVQMEAEKATVRRKERSRLAAETEELTGAVRRARAELRHIGRDLVGRTSKEGLRRAERRVDAAAKLIAVGSPLDRRVQPTPEGVADEPLREDELVPGAPVYVPRLRAVGHVEQAPQRRRVRVRVGSMSAQVPTAELRRYVGQPRPARPAQPTPAAKHRSTAAAPSTDGKSAPLRTSTNTCDLRGKRADEALAELDVFLDRCLREEEAAGFVLHGHGTGALKRAVREHLAESRLVAELRPAELGEGGDAFTIFWLAD